MCVRKERESDESWHESDEDADTDYPERTKWGADWKLCKVGSYAMVRRTWSDNSKGIDVVHVQKVDTEAGKFDAKLLECVSVKHNLAACIKGKWRPSTRGAELETFDRHVVLAYFEQLNSGNMSLPAFVRKLVHDAEEQIFSVSK